MRASIITPTYNSAAYIDACFENVAAQGDVVHEHIIVDGGSSDATIERIRARAAIDPKVRYVPGPDRGQSDAYNKGSAAAAGDVLGLLNADDAYAPGAIAGGLAALAGQSRPSFAAGNCLTIEEDGPRYWSKPRDLRFESLVLGPHLCPYPVNSSSYFYHRAVHEIVGGYDVDDHFAMDYDFVLKCARAVPMIHVDAHWGNFLLHAACKTRADDRAAERVGEIMARHQALLTPAQRAALGPLRARKRIRRTLATLKRRVLPR